MLKVTKFAGSYLQTMGVPSKGGHYLHPEEAVYLLQKLSARVFDTNGCEIQSPAAYGILAKNGVPMHKFTAYAELKDTGLVVLRPRPDRHQEVVTQLGNFRLDEPTTSDQLQNTVLVDDMRPHEGVQNGECFPTIVSRSKIRMEPLHADPCLVSFIPGGLSTFNTKRALSHILMPTTNKTNKKPCRPSFWPSTLPGVHGATNWKHFDALQKRAISSVRLRKFRVVPRSSSGSTSKGSPTSITSGDVDFDVFSPRSFSHNLRTRPAFGVVCLDARLAIEMGRLTQMSNVVLSICEDAKVNFVSSSGQSVDIRSLT